jgi:hypothetical protein
MDASQISGRESWKLSRRTIRPSSPVASCCLETCELAGVIAPRAVAGEEQPVLADPTSIDLLDQPTGESRQPTAVMSRAARSTGRALRIFRG